MVPAYLPVDTNHQRVKTRIPFSGCKKIIWDLLSEVKESKSIINIECLTLISYLENRFYLSHLKFYSILVYLKGRKV